MRLMKKAFVFSVLLAVVSVQAFAAVNFGITSSTEQPVVNGAFDISINVTGSDKIGSISLKITIPIDMVEVAATESNTLDGTMRPIDRINEDGIASVSYAKAAGFTPAAEGTEVIKITCTAKALGDAVFSIDPASLLLDVTDTDGNPLTATSSPKTVTIVDKISYTITATAGEGGSISPADETPHFEGDEPEYEITVNDGYRILSLLVNDEEAIDKLVGNKYTFAPLVANATIAVSFIRQYNVTPNVDPEAGGSIASDSGLNLFDAGAKPTYTVTVNDGYRIKEFKVNETDALSALTADNKYTFAAGLSVDTTIDVVFIRQYTVKVTTAPAEGGKVVSDTGSNVHDVATTPTYTITPAKEANYILDKCVVNDLDVTATLEEQVDGVYTYKFPAMGADATIDVTFKLGVFAVTLKQPKVGGKIEAVRGENTVSIEGDVVTVFAGMPQQFVITTDPNYSILGLKMATADGTGVKPPNYDADDGKFVLTVDQSYLLTVVFQLMHEVMLDAMPAQGGEIAPAGLQYVADGGALDITVTLNDGWDGVLYRTAEGEEKEEVGIYTETGVHLPYTLEDVTKAYEVTVMFKKDGTFHSADCDMDGEIGEPEMLYFISLFKSSGMDGYIYDEEATEVSEVTGCLAEYVPGAVSEEECSLMPHHSADTNGDCYLSLTEFLDTVVLWKYGYVKDPVTGGFVPAEIK